MTVGRQRGLEMVTSIVKYMGRRLCGADQEAVGASDGWRQRLVMESHWI